MFHDLISLTSHTTEYRYSVGSRPKLMWIERRMNIRTKRPTCEALQKYTHIHDQEQENLTNADVIPSSPFFFSSPKRSTAWWSMVPKHLSGLVPWVLSQNNQDFLAFFHFKSRLEGHFGVLWSQPFSFLQRLSFDISYIPPSTCSSHVTNIQ